MRFYKILLLGIFYLSLNQLYAQNVEADNVEIIKNDSLNTFEIYYTLKTNVACVVVLRLKSNLDEFIKEKKGDIGELKSNANLLQKKKIIVLLRDINEIDKEESEEKGTQMQNLLKQPIFTISAYPKEIKQPKEVKNKKPEITKQENNKLEITKQENKNPEVIKETKIPNKKYESKIIGVQSIPKKDTIKTGRRTPPSEKTEKYWSLGLEASYLAYLQNIVPNWCVGVESSKKLYQHFYIETGIKYASIYDIPTFIFKLGGKMELFKNPNRFYRRTFWNPSISLYYHSWIKPTFLIKGNNQMGSFPFFVGMRVRLDDKLDLSFQFGRHFFINDNQNFLETTENKKIYEVKCGLSYIVTNRKYPHLRR